MGLEGSGRSAEGVGALGLGCAERGAHDGTMKDLRRLLDGLDARVSWSAVPREIEGLSYDSRTVRPGDLFFCVRGARHDGHAFADQAVARGAAAVVVETEGPEGPRVIRVPDTRTAMAVAAVRFYDYPSRGTQVLGVTGTNGKTSTAHFTSSIFERAGYPTGVIGTLGYRLGDRWFSASLTTPESLDLQRYLRHMVDAKLKCVVMEVSSHALSLDRVAGTEFHTVVFTNFGHDHLDFHGTLEHYRKAKERLFLNDAGEIVPLGRGRIAVINRDDPVGRAILEKTPLPTVTYGIEREADVRAEGVQLEPDQTTLRIRLPDRGFPVRLRMPGRVNVYNALAAAATAAASLIPPERIAEGLEAVSRVPGRLETIERGQPFSVLVDYAHNPPALERLLTGVREMTRGRLILVFGCGGDRDRAKRPEMARLAGLLADHTVVTSDNPRTEDSLSIIGEIVAGFPANASYEVVPDRGEAIARSIERARAGDSVVIAGKGHEGYQIVGERKIRFDDREAARRVLENTWG